MGSVEVGERSHDRAVTVIFQSAPHAAMTGPIHAIEAGHRQGIDRLFGDQFAMPNAKCRTDVAPGFKSMPKNDLAAARGPMGPGR